MSAPSDRMLKLMAYADGELEGDERLEIEELVAKDAEAADIVTQMGSLGDFVRLGHEDVLAPRLAKIDLSDAIMAAVAREEQTESKPAATSNVASLEAARARKRKIGTVAVAALALAASVFFMIRQNESQKAEAPIAHAPTRAPAAAPPTTEAPVVTASMGTGIEVDPVESPGHSVSVFYLPSESELSTSVVVWVDETGEK